MSQCDNIPDVCIGTNEPGNVLAYLKNPGTGTAFSHDAPVLDGGPIADACLVKGRHAMLNRTHPGRLPIPSCAEPCRRGVRRLHLDLRIGVCMCLGEN
jgi:hypothetical protein